MNGRSAFPVPILSSNRFSILPLRHPLSPFVLSLSKYERTPQIMNGFSILTLRQAQGERIEKHDFDRRSGRGRANGLENEPLTCFLRQAQGGVSNRNWFYDESPRFRESRVSGTE
ncbi:MAG: hypothetical protein LBD67_06660 [Candidatus Accumulibacter sp.]|nr:hypothetical protein [Accumulibacter sp.]